MISVSKNDFEILSFLVRDFSKKYTMRNIALTLKISPAGVFSSLKKLEKANLVKSEKLGTGLFYELNFKNKTAQHLASIIFLEAEAKDADISNIKAKSILLTKQDALIITDSMSISEFSLENMNVTVLTEDEFIQKIRSKDQSILKIIKECKAAKGELELVNLIMRGLS